MNPQVIHAQQPATRVRRAALRYLAAGLVAAAALAACFWLVARPAVVERLRIENRSGLDLEVHVRGADDEGVLPLGTVQHERTETIEDVLDVGERWTFIIERSGEELTRMEMTRARLEARRWRVIIPASVEDQQVGRRDG